MNNLCGCGCNTVGIFIVEGHDYDPKMAGGKGIYFKEYACITATKYLEESSDSFCLPFTKKYVGLKGT